MEVGSYNRQLMDAPKSEDTLSNVVGNIHAQTEQLERVYSQLEQLANRIGGAVPVPVPSKIEGAGSNTLRGEFHQAVDRLVNVQRALTEISGRLATLIG